MKRHEKALAFAWFLLSAGTGLVHALAPGTIPLSIRSVVPPWSVGFVMFASIPLEVSVVEYLTSTGERGNLRDIMPTRAYGYSRARSQISALRVGYLEHVCSLRRAHTVLTISTYRAGFPGTPVMRYLDCKGSKSR